MQFDFELCVDCSEVVHARFFELLNFSLLSCHLGKVAYKQKKKIYWENLVFECVEEHKLEVG